jgi:hypothetical protein
VGCERMPALLDWLLREDFTVTRTNLEKLGSLQEHEAEFLMLGLAYHISCQQDSVCLSTKIMLKNCCKEEPNEKQDSQDGEKKDKEDKKDEEVEGNEELAKRKQERGAGQTPLLHKADVQTTGQIGMA